MKTKWSGDNYLKNRINIQKTIKDLSQGWKMLEITAVISEQNESILIFEICIMQIQF